MTPEKKGRFKEQLGQIILREATSQGELIFHREKLMRHQPVGSNAIGSRSDPVIDFFAAHTAAVTHSASALHYNELNNPQTLPAPLRGPRLTYGSSGPPESTPQSAS